MMFIYIEGSPKNNFKEQGVIALSPRPTANKIEFVERSNSMRRFNLFAFSSYSNEIMITIIVSLRIIYSYT